MEQVLTIGMVAERLNIPVHRAQYYVMSRHIVPTGTAGRLKLYDESVVERMKKVIKNAR